jgi:hypothetical protein
MTISVVYLRQGLIDERGVGRSSTIPKPIVVEMFYRQRSSVVRSEYVCSRTVQVFYGLGTPESAASRADVFGQTPASPSGALMASTVQ